MTRKRDPGAPPRQRGAEPPESSIQPRDPRSGPGSSLPSQSGGIVERAAKEARRRGAQPGNINALKHGLYSKHFQPEELAELAAHTTQDLEGEIELTRIAAHRILTLLEESEKPLEKLALLNAMTIAAMRVASLLKTKKYLGGDAGLTGALQEALAAVAEEQQLMRG